MPMTLNGREGHGLKGHVFDPKIPESLPGWMASFDDARKAREAETLTERYRVLEDCKECSRPLIAEEVLAHKMNHLPDRVRSLVRTVMAADVDVRDETIAALAALTGGK